MTPDKVTHNRMPQSDLRVLGNLNDIRNIESEVEVIIPTLNEGKTIGSVIERCFLYSDKVLVIDGGSDDDTVEIAREMGALIILQNSRGKGGALKEAFEYADSEIIVMLDGDGSMRPEEIPFYLKEIYSGADIVKGSRFISGGKTEDITLFRKFGNTLFTILVNIISKSNFTDLCYGFMAFRKDAVKKLSPILRSKDFDIETEIVIKAKKLGLKIVEVPSLELKRLFGRSKLKSFRDGWKILMTIFREVFI